MGAKERDEARFVPVETVGVWAWQVEADHLENLAECMTMLCDYGYTLVMYNSGPQVLLAVVDRTGRSQSVGHLDWIVFENGEVKTVSQEAFAKNYRRFTAADAKK